MLKRLGVFAVTLVGAVFLLQGLLALAPGDPADLLTSDPELRAQLIQRWGLDQPLPVRTLRALGGALRGDLGESLTVQPGQAVSALLWQRGPASLALLGAALLSSLLVALGLAWRPNTRLRVPAAALSAAPVFLIAALAVLNLNEAAWALMERGWLDRPGWFALPLEDSALRTLLAVAALAVGSSQLGELETGVRGDLAGIRQAPYIEAARGRGEPTAALVWSNLLPGLAQLAASRAAFLLGGLVVIEKVLQLNGAGALLWQAARMRDYPLALGLSLAAAAFVALTWLLADLVRLALDPRLREAR